MEFKEFRNLFAAEHKVRIKLCRIYQESLLTPWSEILFVKLIFPQLFMKFPTFGRPRNSVTALLLLRVDMIIIMYAPYIHRSLDMF